jgi:hypothetical protein
MLWIGDLWDWITKTMTRIWHVVYPYSSSLRTYQEFFQAETPCRGDAFTFRVTVRELWTRRGRLDMLDLESRKETQRVDVERRLRAVSRRYPPEATAVFEHAMNSALTPVKFADDPKLTCDYSVQVAPDDGLVEHLRATAIKHLEGDAEHDRSARHLNHLEEMQARWLVFLRQLDGDPLGHLAARLAGDEELANAIRQHASDQQRIFDDLRDLFDTATEAYRDKDVFDFAMTTDSALRRLLRHIRADETPSPNGTKPTAPD